MRDSKLYVHATKNDIPWYHYLLGNASSLDIFQKVLEETNDWTQYSISEFWNIYHVSQQTVILLISHLEQLTIFPEALLQVKQEIESMKSDYTWFLWWENKNDKQ